MPDQQPRNDASARQTTEGLRGGEESEYRDPDDLTDAEQARDIAGEVNSSTQQLSLIANDGPRGGVYQNQNPPGEYIESENKTFIVWRGPDADPYAITYDHTTDAFTARTKIGTNTLPNDDQHGPPTLTVGPDGTVLVIWGGHVGRPQRIAVSDNPYDTSSWTIVGEMDDLGVPNGTYTSVCTYQGDFYAIYRASPPGRPYHGDTYPAHEFATLIRSTDSGQTWTDLGPVIDLSGHPDDSADAYVQDLDVFDGELRLSWNVAHGAGHDDHRESIYHAIYDPGADELRALDGTVVSSPVTWSDINDSSAAWRVYQGTASGVRHIVHDGTTYVSFARTPDSTDLTTVARYSDSAGWVVTETDNITAGAYNTAPLHVYEDGSLSLFTIEDVDGFKSGDLVRFDKESDGVWTKHIVSPAPHDGTGEGWRPVETIRNGSDELTAVVCEDDDVPDGTSARLMAVGELSQNATEVMASDPEFGRQDIDTSQFASDSHDNDAHSEAYATKGYVDRAVSTAGSGGSGPGSVVEGKQLASGSVTAVGGGTQGNGQIAIDTSISVSVPEDQRFELSLTPQASGTQYDIERPPKLTDQWNGSARIVGINASWQTDPGTGNDITYDWVAYDPLAVPDVEGVNDTFVDVTRDPEASPPFTVPHDHGVRPRFIERMPHNEVSAQTLWYPRDGRTDNEFQFGLTTAQRNQLDLTFRLIGDAPLKFPIMIEDFTTDLSAWTGDIGGPGYSIISGGYDDNGAVQSEPPGGSDVAMVLEREQTPRDGRQYEFWFLAEDFGDGSDSEGGLSTNFQQVSGYADNSMYCFLYHLGSDELVIQRRDNGTRPVSVPADAGGLNADTYYRGVVTLDPEVLTFDCYDQSGAQTGSNSITDATHQGGYLGLFDYRPLTVSLIRRI